MKFFEDGLIISKECFNNYIVITSDQSLIIIIIYNESTFLWITVIQKYWLLIVKVFYNKKKVKKL